MQGEGFLLRLEGYTVSGKLFGGRLPVFNFLVSSIILALDFLREICYINVKFIVTL